MNLLYRSLVSKTRTKTKQIKADRGAKQLIRPEGTRRFSTRAWKVCKARNAINREKKRGTPSVTVTFITSLSGRPLSDFQKWRTTLMEHQREARARTKTLFSGNEQRSCYFFSGRPGLRRVLMGNEKRRRRSLVVACFSAARGTCCRVKYYFSARLHHCNNSRMDLSAP
jgi:hypothetical protein